MQRHIFKFIPFFLIFVFILNGCSKKADLAQSRAKDVVVYTYDSFCGEWGAGQAIAKKFTEKTGLKVTYVDCGDGVQILSRSVLEKDNPYVDVILGLDNNLALKAQNEDILESYKPQGIEEIPENLVAALGDKNLLTPYDYAPFAFIYDTKSKIEPPKSLDDLTNPQYKKKIILMNPRTSTPGLGFVTWTYAAKGKEIEDFWKALKPNILTMAPGWSAGYGLFLNGEAPLVISYSSSAAYHYEYDKTDRYKALIFSDGHIMQVEGAGLAKNAPNKKGAKLFLDFLISKEAQSEIPLKQWMLPANKTVELPASYIQACPTLQKLLSYDATLATGAVERIMDILNK
ncbi:thiamine ABC transporter substrate-binding protein [Treponema pectinovorum]|uniref:thiamine ABC transporter substrate-binding protein n=1 Tax=Treponema pectinovorum TaxID=164 RepID=UPI0011CC7626|nr:thiamine ABC transporter substrate-binding protein [Treponema pectinovorum]